ncbi:MAG: hypothetical protein LBP67_01790 [Bacteroidales bacterium]|jgi:hypothetical protein|nr:hypothetical protein [Bacteroidales bacterium]
MKICPIFKFALANTKGEEFPVKLIWGDEASKSVTKEDGYYFFREKLNGTFTLFKNDLRTLNNFDIDEEIILLCYISYNRLSWELYAKGKFYYTDCWFNQDDLNVSFSVREFDKYSQFLTDIDREFNLIELAPAAKRISYDKRPCLQIYGQGDSSLGCFIGGTYWEQSCGVVTNESELSNKYRFSFAGWIWNCNVTSPREEFNGVYIMRRENYNEQQIEDVTFYKYDDPTKVFKGEYNDNGGVNPFWTYAFYDNGEENPALEILSIGGDFPYDVYFPNNQIAVTGFYDMKLWARWFLGDIDNFDGQTTFPIPDEDITDNNLNYSKVVRALNVPVYINDQYTTHPTQYGLRKDSQVDYYLPPPNTDKNFIPIGRNSWGDISAWYSFSDYDWQLEVSGRENHELRDSYSFADSINVILQKLGTGITHEATPDYSMVLYSSLSLFPNVGHLFLTQNTNILHGEYTQPAQKLNITLRKLLDTVCNAYNLSWWIDEQNRLRIEHVYFFRNGFSYTPPETIFDLTALKCPPHGKSWAFGLNKCKYDLSNISAQIVLKLQDKQSKVFEGYPIEILAAYAKDGAITNLSIECDTDIDFALVSPEDINKDGFTLFACDKNGDDYSVRYVTLNDGTKDKLVLQNGTLSIYFLAANYHKFDKPSRKLLINNEEVETIGISKNKTQEVRFPSIKDLDTTVLIKTEMGIGQIDGYTISLNTRYVRGNLKYETEKVNRFLLSFGSRRLID